MSQMRRSGIMALAACVCLLPLRSAGGDDTAPRVQAPATSSPEKLVLTVGKSMIIDSPVRIERVAVANELLRTGKSLIDAVDR